MRVIAGSARSLPLKTVPGMNTRPTQDRIKETLFNMLQNQIPGSVFLDIFAGSGGIGIEALSRGAEECVFIEHEKEAVKCIHENLIFTHLENHASVMECDALMGLQRLNQTGHNPFDIIFMDPPYDHLWEQQVLKSLSQVPYVTGETLIIIEASLKTDFSYLNEYGFELIREKKYKTNQHVFVRKKE